jgi:alpha-tubulin suppressor-like RCC1 family protein
MYAFGRNATGQLGIPSGEEAVPLPVLLPSPDCSDSLALVRICANATQTDVVTAAGLLYTCGENGENELGRGGKGSVLARVDAVETFRITDVAVG